MWIATDYGFNGYGVNGGKVGIISQSGGIEVLEMPEGMSAADARPIMATFCLGEKSRLHGCGGLSENWMVTENRFLLRPFITPISEEIIESAAPGAGQIGVEKVAASTGLVGKYILYLRWGDRQHARRSPFSGASPTLDLDGTKALKLRQVPRRPTPEDICVDVVEVWGNRNGENLDGRLVIRHLATRDAGAATITITEIAEGAAETADNLQAFPTCRMCLVFHNRLWMWGNADDPTAVFGSILNRTDEYGGLRVPTLDGDEVVAGVEVRNVFAIFGPKATYTLAGFSESDFDMDRLDRDVGCICHAGIAKWGEDAIIPTHKGLHLFDGQTMVNVSGDFEKLWTDRYAANPTSFEQGFGVFDKKAGVYKFYEQFGLEWVLDFRATPPLLSFDSHSDRPLCGANLPLPKSKSFETYSGTTAGLILLENVPRTNDNGSDFEVVIMPALQGRIGATHDDGQQLNELWLFLSNYGLSPSHFDLRIISGNEFAGFLNDPGSSTIAALLQLPHNVDGKFFDAAHQNQVPFEVPAGAGNTKTPMPLVFTNLQMAGEYFAPRIAVTGASKLIYRGWGLNFSPGRKHAAAVESSD